MYVLSKFYKVLFVNVLFEHAWLYANNMHSYT